MRTPRKLSDRDRERAVTLICKSIVNVDLSVVKKMLCLAVGHPPAFKYVVDRYSVNATINVCPRCGERVMPAAGEWEASGDNLWTMGKLTPTDLLLTGVPVVEKVPV